MTNPAAIAVAAAERERRRKMFEQHSQMVKSTIHMFPFINYPLSVPPC